jgi:transposase
VVHDQLKTEMAPIQTHLRQLLEDASPKNKRNRWHRRLPTTCSRSGPRSGRSPPTPTNNPAEGALRGPVIHRKLSHGTRSDDGERFAERVLTAAATCRQQGRSLFEFLTELITAHTRGDPLPALA